MLLNLEYAVKCDAFVGTLASNWCRLVDELRTTVGKREERSGSGGGWVEGRGEERRGE